MRERWFVEDYELTQGAVRDVEYRAGQMGTPAMRGGNATVAGRTGGLWAPKVHDEGSFTLSMWWGTRGQQAAQTAYDLLLRAMIGTHRLYTWRRITPAGEERLCKGEVVAALEPRAVGQSAYRVDVEVNVPPAYWLSAIEYSQNTTAGGTAPVRLLELPNFAGGTAPNEALRLLLTGGQTNPKVEDITPKGRGDWVKYTGSIPDDQGLLIDCANWSLVGVNGFSPDKQRLTYSNDSRFFALAAALPDQTQTLRLTTDAMTAKGKLTVTGPLSYLC